MIWKDSTVEYHLLDCFSKGDASGIFLRGNLKKTGTE